MKKSLATLALLLAAVLGASGALPQTATTQAPPQQRKEIKDPGEYNAYVTALNQQDPNSKVQAFEAFLQQYPNSVVKVEALEVLLATYQQLGKAAKVEETANRILQVDPFNLRALALMAYLRRAAAEAGQTAQQNAAEARQFGERGLQALEKPKPEGVSQEDFEKLKSQTSLIFNGAAGFGALQAKDYKAAQKYFQAAVNQEPKNLRDVYPLAVAYLEDSPINPLGLWYVARGVVLSNNNAGIVKYGRFKYIKYHGSEEGWDQLVAQAQASPTPPAGWSVPSAPSPAEQARILVSQKEPKKMNFAEWELVLSQGEPAVQDKVWSAIKGLRVPFAAQVISATRTTLSLAATADAIQAKQADVEVTMASAFAAARVPKAGADIQIIAIPDSYTAKPFLMKMTDGQLFGQEKAAPAPKKTPPRRRRG